MPVRTIKNTSYETKLDIHTTEEIAQLNPEQGALVFDTTTKTQKIYTGTEWVDLQSPEDWRVKADLFVSGSSELDSDLFVYGSTNVEEVNADSLFVRDGAPLANSILGVSDYSDAVAGLTTSEYSKRETNHTDDFSAAGGNANMYHSVSIAENGGSGNINNLVGTNPIARNTGTGNVDWQGAILADSKTSGGGFVDTLLGTYTIGRVDNGTAGDVLGAWAIGQMKSGAGTAEKLYGMEAEARLEGGDVTSRAMALSLDIQSLGGTAQNAYYLYGNNNSLVNSTDIAGEKLFIKDVTGLSSEFSNDVKVGNNLEVIENATIGNDLTVDGNVALTSDTNIGGGVFVDGYSEFYDDVMFDGAAEFNSGISVSQDFFLQQGGMVIQSTTVSALPAASALSGAIRTVSDASAISYRGVATGGGSDIALVMSDGTNWIYH